jgi:hypothetical protein
LLNSGQKAATSGVDHSIGGQEGHIGYVSSAFFKEFCVNFFRRSHVAIAAAAALSVGLLAVPALATTISYSLDTFTGSGTPPAGPYGTVTLDDHNASSVEVTLVLAPGVGLTNTGAGAALTWDLLGNPVVTITGLNTTNFTVSRNGTSTGNLDGTGSWFYEIDCTDAACGSGGSHPYTGALDFTILNVTLADFISNGRNPPGYFFASDICTQVGPNGQGCAGITGDIASTTTTTNPLPQPAPEPATLGLLGLGLAALGFSRKRAN